MVKVYEVVTVFSVSLEIYVEIGQMCKLRTLMMTFDSAN